MLLNLNLQLLPSIHTIPLTLEDGIQNGILFQPDHLGNLSIDLANGLPVEVILHRLDGLSW